MNNRINKTKKNAYTHKQKATDKKKRTKETLINR